MTDILKDCWFLFGRLFPFPTKPGLRQIGNPDRSSPVLVTGNFELTVRKVVQTLKRDGIDVWLLVVPTKGINVWCASGAGHFTADTIVSIIKTSGIEKLVDHQQLILPQLAASGVNIWAVRDRTGWKPRFGPADIKDVAAYIENGKSMTERIHRRVAFELQDRFVMGTNLGFNVALLLVLPLIFASVWITGLWWKTLSLLFALSVLCSVLVFWLPGKPGVPKGFSLGILAAAVFVLLSQTISQLGPWSVLGWTGWILVVSMFIGYDLPSWSPLWRQDARELVLGVKNTHVEVSSEKCVGCHLCDVVCPTNVFGYNAKTKKYEVENLDACQACGACIENCPTEAIANNFHSGVCSCPTCFVINQVDALKNKKDEGHIDMVAHATDTVCCDSSGLPVGPEQEDNTQSMAR